MSNLPDNDNKKRFGLTDFSVDNATSVFFLFFMICFFGIISYVSIPKESFPEIPFPQIFINTVYFGNSAKDIENLVSKPLEKEIEGITGLKSVTSNSQQDYSMIVAEFNSDVNMEVAVRKLKDAVDRAKPDLPTDLTKDPEVLEINLAELPIMTVNMAGDYSSEELKIYAKYLKEKIEDLREVSKVDIKGDQEKEVKIDVDPLKMRARQVSFDDIQNAVRSENVTMSGGELVNNDFRRTIRVVGEFEEVSEIGDIIVKAENMHAVYIKDIADVSFAYKDRTSIARADLLPVISLDVIKKKGENLLDASDKIKEIVEIAKKEYLPENLKVTVFNDQSIQTRNMVSNLENSIISGVILVVLVLLFFMGLRNAMFVGIAIPLSMLLGFLVISMLGYTMNMVILFSLILALGMLVDNGIVVVENIFRYMQNGYDSFTAAKLATGEVAIPIIASTATTLAAFVPLAFWPGLMGAFMKYLPITLIIVLTSSLFVALVINPVLAATLMKIDARANDPAIRRRRIKNNTIMGLGMFGVSILAHFAGVMWLRNSLWITGGITLLNIWVLRDASFWFQAKALTAMERGYNNFATFALRKYNPAIIFGGTFLLLIFSLMLLGARAPKVILFPIADPLYVNAFVELPMGTDIESSNKMMLQLEKKVQEIVGPYGTVVEAVLAQVGENTSDPNAGPEFGASPNKGRITVSFVPSEERGGVSTVDILEKIQEGTRGYTGVEIVVAQNADGPPQGKPINIEVQGEDMEQLSQLSSDMLAYIESQNIEGIEELKADVLLGKPELMVSIDRDAAKMYGISTYQVADAIRTSVFGKEISKYKTEDEDYPIVIRMNADRRNNIDAVLNQSITFRNPANGRIAQVPISAVAKKSYSSTYSSVKRKNQERIITLFSNVLEGYNPNEVVADINDALDKYDMPKGYSFRFTGQQQEQAENMEFLSTAFLVAVFAIFLILVAQFNSILAPFIIILAIVFSTIGVFLGYVFTGMDIQIVMTGVGIISLAGIVVNNAIVLIDYTNILMADKRIARGLPLDADLEIDDVKDAIVEAGATRLRPVLLTAITTVLGLVPLAIGFNFNFFTLISEWDPKLYIGGDNAAFWGTMAWTVIYGLTFATFLTLVVVPVMYLLTIRLTYFAKSLFNKA